VTVQVVDQFGNLVTTDNSFVTLALGSNPGSSTLNGTLTVAAVGGVATFSSLSVNTAATGYTISAVDGSLGSAISSTFTITDRRLPTIFLFSQQPAPSTVAGVSISRPAAHRGGRGPVSITWSPPTLPM